MANDVPPEFYDCVDKFIHLANEMTGEHGTTRVSAVILFAAARYNAHCMLAQDPDLLQNRAKAIEYFLEQYRMMLDDNIDWLTRLQSKDNNDSSK